MQGEWRFHISPNVIFGRGAVRRTGEAVGWYGADRVLLVTDPGWCRRPARGAEPRCARLASPSTVGKAAGRNRRLRPSMPAWRPPREQDYGALVALGGGSNTDLAKAVAVVLRYGGSATDYFGEHKVPGPILPLIAVSTTAGTGAEVSGASVLADLANNRRGSILSNFVRPLAAIYDPLLTVSCPPVVTADAGIDALAHAVEAYMTTDYRIETGAEGVPAYTTAAFPCRTSWSKRPLASSASTCAGPSTGAETWRPGRACTWPACWRAWGSPMPA